MPSPWVSSLAQRRRQRLEALTDQERAEYGLPPRDTFGEEDGDDDAGDIEEEAEEEEERTKAYEDDEMVTTVTLTSLSDEEDTDDEPRPRAKATASSSTTNPPAPSRKPGVVSFQKKAKYARARVGRGGECEACAYDGWLIGELPRQVARGQGGRPRTRPQEPEAQWEARRRQKQRERQGERQGQGPQVGATAILYNRPVQRGRPYMSPLPVRVGNQRMSASNSCACAAVGVGP